MADEEKNIRILSWPDSPATVEHKFKMEKSCPVSISFEESVAHVAFETTPQDPLYVDMAMRVRAEDVIPVCVKVCEPICLTSRYQVDITIFDRPVASITLSGLTRVFNCEAEHPALVCYNFQEIEPKKEFTAAAPLVYQGIKFIPLDASIWTVFLGEPAGQVKLSIPRSGLRLEFPVPVAALRLTVNNYAGNGLDFKVYSGGSLVSQFFEPIVNEVKVIPIAESQVTSVEITGGNNEASLIEVCFSRPPQGILKMAAVNC